MITFCCDFYNQDNNLISEFFIPKIFAIKVKQCIFRSGKTLIGEKEGIDIG